MKTTAWLVVLMAWSGVARGETNAPGTVPEMAGKPEPSGGRVVGQIVIGALGGIGGALAGGLIGYEIEMRGDCSSEYCGVGGALIGGYVGSALGVSAGVWSVGSLGDQTGSVGATVGGAALGGLVGGGLGLYLWSQDADEAGVAVMIAGPVVGSMLGFHATRRYKSRVTVSAFGARPMIGLAGSF